jgi:hypothetical protein
VRPEVPEDLIASISGTTELPIDTCLGETEDINVMRSGAVQRNNATLVRVPSSIGWQGCWALARWRWRCRRAAQGEAAPWTGSTFVGPRVGTLLVLWRAVGMLLWMRRRSTSEEMLGRTGKQLFGFLGRLMRLWLLLLDEVVLLGEVLLVRMRVLWLRLLRLLELTVPMGHKEAEHLLKLLHEHGHVFVLLVAGGLVLLLHGESLGLQYGCCLRSLSS